MKTAFIICLIVVVNIWLTALEVEYIPWKYWLMLVYIIICGAIIINKLDNLDNLDKEDEENNN